MNIGMIELRRETKGLVFPARGRYSSVNRGWTLIVEEENCDHLRPSPGARLPDTIEIKIWVPTPEASD